MNMLTRFGGILENNAQEATLDDFWAINLDKLDGWNCLHRSEIVWSQEANSDDEEGPSSSDSSGFSTEEEEEGVPEETVRAARKDVFLGFPQYVEAVDTGPSEAEKVGFSHCLKFTLDLLLGGASKEGRQVYGSSKSSGKDHRRRAI